MRILLTFLLMPLILSAGLIKTNKCDMLTEALSHKKAASQHLLYAKDMCLYIPDLESRTHMTTLISSAMSSVLVTNPKDKFLTVGLSLIGGLAANLYEKYCEYRSHLVNAAYHMEQYAWYTEISLQITGYDSTDEGTKYFLQAIDHLTISDMFVQAIKDEYLRDCISASIVSHRQLLLAQLSNPHGKLTNKIINDTIMFCENMDEMMLECEDNAIFHDVNIHISASLDYLMMAKNNWNQGNK